MIARCVFRYRALCKIILINDSLAGLGECSYFRSTRKSLLIIIYWRDHQNVFKADLVPQATSIASAIDAAFTSAVAAYS